MAISEAQREAFKKYNKNSVKHLFRYHKDSEYGKLLQKAKESKTLNDNFKKFLKDTYGDE